MMNSLSNSNTATKKPTLIQEAIDAQFIKDAKGFHIQLSLIDIDDLAEPLHYLAKAQYYLSNIYDELIKVGETEILDREKLISFINKLCEQLEKTTYALAEFDNNAKKLSKRLEEMAENLLISFYADEETLSHIHFIDFILETIEISRLLDSLCEIVLSDKTKGANNEK